MFKHCSFRRPSRYVKTLAVFVVLGTLPGSASGAAPGSWRGQSITEFNAEENAAFSWQVVNDGVMGVSATFFL